MTGNVSVDPMNLHRVLGTSTSFTTELSISDTIRIGNDDLVIGKILSNTELLTLSPLVLGQSLVQEVDLRGDTISDLNNKHWQIYSANDATLYHVWYNVSGMGTDPSGLPGSIGVEVTIGLNNTNQQVAIATMLILNTLGDFIVSNPYLGKLKIQNIIAGEQTKAFDGDINGTFNVNVLSIGTGNSSNIIAGTSYTKLPKNNQLSFVILNEKYISSYVYDPTNTAFTATSTRCVLTQIVDKGTIQPQITVEGADSFPNDVGFLVFDFGKEREEVPVKYRGRPNNNTLLVDPSYIFKKQHKVGEVINLLTQPLLGTKPRRNGGDYPAYVTGLVEARIAVENILKSIKAAGVSARFIIDTPEYLWETSWNPLDEV